MTLYKFDKEGVITDILEDDEKDESSKGVQDTTALNATKLLDRKQEPVDWTKVEWPFEEVSGDHVLVQISEFEYHGSVEIPDEAKRDPTLGRVVMIGSEVTKYKIGDRVLYTQFAGYLLKFEGIPKCRIMSEPEVLARLKEKTPKLVMEGA